MARITFSIPDDLAAAAERRAQSDRRSLSAHIALLVENDARAAGMLPGAAHADLIATAEEYGVDEAQQILDRALAAKKDRAKRAARRAA